MAVRATQVAVEVLTQPDDAKLRATQVAVEVLVRPVSGRVSLIVIN